MEEYENFIGVLLERIRDNNIILRYNSLLALDILSILQLKARVEHFSFALFYLLIKKETGQISSLLENDEELDIAITIEILLLTADILDDIIDDDDEITKICGKEVLMLLVTELLVWSINKLSLIPLYHKNSKYLNEALYGEWNDINFKFTDELIDEEFYFRKILKKSESLFNFVCGIADDDNEEVWKKFSEYYAAYLQINNDVSDIYNSNKSDIDKKRVTLPLIKAYQLYTNEVTDASINSNLSFQKFSIDSGAIEYSLMIQLEYKNQCKQLLKSYFNNDQILDYLELDDESKNTSV